MICDMGTQNRARRAAKQRNRSQSNRRREPDQAGNAAFRDLFGGPVSEDVGSSGPDLADVARNELLLAARRITAGQSGIAIIGPLVSGALVDQARVVDAAAAAVLGGNVSVLFAHGWTPVDLVEIGRRRLDAAGESYLLDAVAATARTYSSVTLHPQWQAALAQSGAECWWRPELPHLTQWQERVRHSRADALLTVVTVLAMLNSLPVLQEVVPPPGSVVGNWQDDSGEPVDERMLAKVRALLAKAEATEFDEEAEALSAKAQELMTRYSLHRAVADHSHGVRQSASVRRIWLDAPYVSGKSMLVHEVAEVNRCRSVVAEQLGYVAIVGDDVDQRVVEVLSTSLLIQASRAMMSAGVHTTRYGTSRTRSFRHSFLIAYAGRIGERLRESTVSAMDGEDSAMLLPVLAARSRVVEERFAEAFPSLVSKKVSVSNGDGWRAGRAAADLARLDVQQSLRGTG